MTRPTDLELAKADIKLLREFAELKRKDGWPHSAKAMERAISRVESYVLRAEKEN